MKTLIIQFARLGDIYQSWPVARAIKRMNPQSEIHFLVRPRFKSALNGIGCVEKVWTLPIEELISPLVGNEFNLETSLNKLEEFQELLLAEKYDLIVNLSFSPASSFFAKSVSHPQTVVRGYTRHEDGYLNLSDDVSRYFWAQVGPGFPNRVHLIDLFGGVAGVDFSPEDFHQPQGLDLTRKFTNPYFVLHVGASESHKRLLPEQWVKTIEAYRLHDPKTKWVLVGSKDEQSIARDIEKSLLGEGSHQVIMNKVGQTSIEDLFGLIQHSEGLIGCDSVAMHMATYVDQRAFCISMGQTKFWETGPVTVGSAVATVSSGGAYLPSVTASQILNWTKGLFEGVYQVVEQVPRYVSSTIKHDPDEFPWKLIQAVYMGASYPVTSDFEFYKGCLRLFEANSVAIQNLVRRDRIQRATLTSLLDRIDEVFLAVVSQVPHLTPLLRWYQAEKTRIQPGTFDQIAQDTVVIHQVFSGLLKRYLLEEDVRKVERDGNI